MKKSIINFLVASFSNALEHYATALFPLLAPFLAPMLFQHMTPIEALISTYFIMPLGFISRPLGALIFGKLGDTKGRKIVLIITLLGLALTTVCMGSIPISKQAGWAAPTLFAIGSFVQKFFASGEIIGGALLVLESSPPHRRPLMNALYESSTLIGILIASITVTALSLHGLIETSWRFLYWIGGSMGIASLMIRLFATTTPIVSKKHQPLFSLLWKERRLLMVIILSSGFAYANYYMLTSFLNGFLPLVSGISKSQAAHANTYLLFIDFLILLCLGGLTLYLPKEKFLLCCGCLGSILAIPLYACLDGATLVLASCIRFVFLIIGIGFSVVLIPFYQECIPRDKRLTLIAFGTALGSQIFGTISCPLGFWLYKQTGWAGAPGVYLMAIGMTAFWSLLLSKRALFKQTQSLTDRFSKHTISTYD